MELTSMDLAMESGKRRDITIRELARHILRIAMRVNQLPAGHQFFGHGIFRHKEYEGTLCFNPQSLLHEGFLREYDGRHERGVVDKAFTAKFYEAVALLKNQELLMDYSGDWIALTSIGNRSRFENEVLILLDDAQEIVSSLKEEAPNLDPVVEQYYLESLRACQRGLYISSVICLGAASERAVNCLVQAVNEKYSQHGGRLEELRSISAQINYLVDRTNFNQIFGFIEDDVFRDEIKDRLSGIAHIYRRNRNEAGHPGPIPMDITRDEQESYLNSFRRYAMTIFRAIDMLNSTP